MKTIILLLLAILTLLLTKAYAQKQTLANVLINPVYSSEERFNFGDDLKHLINSRAEYQKPFVIFNIEAFAKAVARHETGNYTLG